MALPQAHWSVGGQLHQASRTAVNHHSLSSSSPPLQCDCRSGLPSLEESSTGPLMCNCRSRLRSLRDSAMTVNHHQQIPNNSLELMQNCLQPQKKPKTDCKLASRLTSLRCRAIAGVDHCCSIDVKTHCPVSIAGVDSFAI